MKNSKIWTAIMKSKNLTILKATTKVALACAAIASSCWTAGDICNAQTPPSNLSPDLQEVVKLSQEKMGDDVITNYIRSSGKTYKLSADDIIYLNSQGVSRGVLTVLLQTASSGGIPAGQNPPPTASVPTTSANPAPSVAPSSPVPPPLDANPGPSTVGSTPIPQPAPPPAPAFSLPPTAQPGLQDNFFSDGALNPSLWETQSGILAALGSMSGYHVLPTLAFSPSGMQMAGVRGPGQFMGIQSTASFVPPFTFNVTVAGMSQTATPFEIYLISSDLRQRVSIAGHLGGLGRPRGDINIGAAFGHAFHGDINIPMGGNSPDYGVWINYTSSGLPVSALGYKFFDNPIAGVPYTFQISVGANGAASVSLLNSAGGVLVSQNVPIGMGPFYVVLAGRDGPTVANWQSVQLTPAMPVVAEVSAAPPVPTFDYFQAQLSPYGNWVTVPGFGLCWQPSVDPGWRPYYDGGYWVYSDAGWYWQSAYPWGDIAFHYGRWTYTVSGWVWVPGYDYAPAWVLWRHADADGYIGWAPLPPGAVFIDGGWMFNGVRVGFDFTFGLGADFFTFVACDHFWEHDFRHFIVPHDRLAPIYRRSLIENHFRLDHGRFINDGLSRDRMATLTHRDVQEIKPMAVHDLKQYEEQRNISVRREEIQNFKPGNTKPNAWGVTVPGKNPINNRGNVGEGVNRPAANPYGNQNGQQFPGVNSPAGGRGGNTDSR
jgi:hypothetical protein